MGVYETSFTVEQRSKPNFNQQMSWYQQMLLNERIKQLQHQSSELLNGIWQNIEINIGPWCVLSCKYCYLHRFGNRLYPQVKPNTEAFARNFEIFVRWLDEQNAMPKTIDIFGGDILQSQHGLKLLQAMIDTLKTTKKQPNAIVIPTNGVFLFSEPATSEVERLIEKAKPTELILSLSIDGKYFDDLNRPHRAGLKRTDEYYERAFQFAKKYNFGFHPMVYSNGIEHWVDNFLWFMQMYDKYKIPYGNLYLLEVRNAEWTPKQIIELCKFARFLTKFGYTVAANEDAQCYVDIIAKGRLFNMLGYLLSTTSRGISCSLQTGWMINLGDLSVQSCHRTDYDYMRLGKFVVENDKIVGFEAVNPEFYTTLMSFHTRSMPICEVCPVNLLCNGICPGQITEETGEQLGNLPTQCAMEMAKIMTFIYTYNELGLFKHWNLSSEFVLQVQSALEMCKLHPEFVPAITADDQEHERKIKNFLQTRRC